MKRVPIHYKPVPHIYPDSKGIKIHETAPPADLEKLINKLQKVKRFNDGRFQTKGVVPDNTKAHTIRCAFRSQTIPYQNEILTRIVWVHDIPEVFVEFDINAIEKSINSKLAEVVEKEERKAAKKVLGKEDYELWKQFQIAENLINRTDNKYPKAQEALIAKIIDFIDGNLIYTYFFTRWLFDNKYNGRVPPKSCFEYAVKSYKRSSKILENLDKNIEQIGKYLLRNQLKQLLQLWKVVDQNKIPKIMQREIIKTKNIVG